jgi:hypothetical protein
VSETRIPLRLSRDRVWLYGGVLVLLGHLRLILAPRLWKGDWAYFVAGGATAGTPDLLGPRHVAWEVSHGVSLALPWAYPPAVAWFFWPFNHVSLGLGFWINATIMLGACIASGVVAAKVYRLPVAFSILAVLAWAPAVLSVSGGQNASLALLLCMLCIFGLVRRQPMVAGTAVGLLLFKPTDAAVFVLLLLLRREWRALVVVAAAGIAWYLASVPAAAGDWMWPYHFAAYLYAYYPHQQYPETLINASALAMRLGLPMLFANGISVVLLLAWCSIAVRVSMLEAASFAGLFAIATSTHANPHEAALALPSIFYIMKNVAEPWRTRIVAGAYVTACISNYLRVSARGFEPLVFLILFGALFYLRMRLRHPGAHNPLNATSEILESSK